MLADQEAAGGPAAGSAAASPGPFHRLLLRFEPERAHGLALAGLRAVQALPPVRRLVAKGHRLEDPRLEQELLGLLTVPDLP